MYERITLLYTCDKYNVVNYTSIKTKQTKKPQYIFSLNTKVQVGSLVQGCDGDLGSFRLTWPLSISVPGFHLTLHPQSISSAPSLHSGSSSSLLYIWTCCILMLRNDHLSFLCPSCRHPLPPSSPFPQFNNMYQTVIEQTFIKCSPCARHLHTFPPVSCSRVYSAVPSLAREMGLTDWQRPVILNAGSTLNDPWDF